MRGIALSIPETLEGTYSDVNGGKAVELDNGFAEGDGECCHDISPHLSGAALLPHTGN